MASATSAAASALPRLIRRLTATPYGLRVASQLGPAA